MKKLMFILLLILMIMPSILSTQEYNEQRQGLFVIREGNGEIGKMSNGKTAFSSDIGSRKVVGTNSVMNVKSNSEGEFMTQEGETTLFESTTLTILKFTESILIQELLQGKIRANLLEMSQDYPYVTKTQALTTRTTANSIYEITHNRAIKKSKVEVFSGKMKVFSSTTRRGECIILSEGQSIEMKFREGLSDVELPSGVEIIEDCYLDTTDEYLREEEEDLQIEIQTYPHEGESANDSNESDDND